ncbi:hypothetical protein GH714_000002 [Hevea brasiliensis]|uniref:non-specific serine/threonine protein kinase n=1 Tax=Hevea brasiliensis TaxID=3981 RepID=A0A6A6KWZ5_HEVBR|nr:hypothetical protein GH714_000002 [Hevea brasiliensis]
MKCFHYFKDKSRSRQQRSAPELKEQSKSDYSGSGTHRIAKSSCSETSARRIPELYEEKARNLRVFSFSELRHATHDFDRLLRIGEGGFGSVYKGSIKPADGKGEPIVVAIKKLNKDGLQGHKQWVAEVQFLGVVEHPNLVKLVGYCAADGERGIQRLLVYEFMPNKSLEDHLFNRAYPALPWKTRLQIILGAAQGLAYLHEGLEIQVIYRDFKTSNVLLDENFKPKLSDFGLAREGPVAGRTHVSTAVMGTNGYAAPDYIETGHLTTKSDVWSSGVVLYEIITGRRSLERNRPRAEQKLLEWVKQFPPDSKKFGLIIDPRLENQYSIAAARKIARLADSCLMKSAKDRPKMTQVVESLKQIIQDSDEEATISKESFEPSETDSADSSKEPNQLEATESWKRRMTHLAKLVLAESSLLSAINSIPCTSVKENFNVFIGGLVPRPYSGGLYAFPVQWVFARAIDVVHLYLQEGRDLMGGFFFAILLCFKHLFAVAAPVYFVYLLRHYCWKGLLRGFWQLISMGIVVMVVFAAAYGPFLYHGQIQQVISRMFPFGRGLCHAYWAPNFWVFYIALDKGLAIFLRKLGLNIQAPAASFTGGLVGDSPPFSVLPKITPITTFIMVLLALSPCLFKAWKNPQPQLVARWIAYAYTCGFLFGWHVHEKASLHFVVPLSIVAVHSLEDARHYFLLAIVSCYSLFPLLYEAQEYPIKVLLLLLHSILMWHSFSAQITKDAAAKVTVSAKTGGWVIGIILAARAIADPYGDSCVPALIERKRHEVCQALKYY